MSKKAILPSSENIRKRILDVINKTLSEEMDTVPIGEEHFLYESNLDSFGYAVFWISLWENTKLEFANELSSIEGKDISGILSKEYIDSLDIRFYEVSELVDRIEMAFSKCQH